MFILIFCVSVFTLSLIFSGTYYLRFYRNTTNRRRVELDRLGRAKVPVEIKNSLELLIQRRCNYINKFHAVQIINKTAGFVSVSYSVIVIIQLALPSDKLWENYTSVGWGLPFLAPLLAVLSAIVEMYLVPATRAGQYLDAWRKTDLEYNRLMSELTEFERIETIRKQEGIIADTYMSGHVMDKSEKVAATMAKIENNLDPNSIRYPYDDES